MIRTTILNLIENDRIPEALEILERDESLKDPWTQSIEAYYLISRCYFFSNELEKAAMYAQMVALHPAETNPIVLIDVLTILVKNLSLRDAMAALEARRNIFTNSDIPLSQEDLRQLIAIANSVEAYTLALDILDAHTQSFEKLSDYYLLKATVYKRADNIEGQKEALINALTNSPEDSNVHAHIADLFARFDEHTISAEHNQIAEKTNKDGIHPNIAMNFFTASQTGGIAEQERLKHLWLQQIESDQAFRAPFGLLTATEDPNLIFNENLRFSEMIYVNHDRKPKSKVRPVTQKNKKIRLGYFSPDFKNHAVTHLITDLFKYHDTENFEVFAFSISNPDESIYRERIKIHCQEFFEFENTNTSTIAETANKLDLDYAIDLAGYTRGFRPQLLERLKDSLIVNFLGYPSTVGAGFYDFIIGDNIVTPEGCEPYFSEQIIRLNRCYQCNSPSRKTEDSSRMENGLPSDKFIFCNFNTRQKLNIDTLQAWKNIISQCPDAVLWVLHPGQKVASEYEQIFGDDFQRVIFADKVSVERHLGRIKHGNLFLDSFPYGAHTTASDAIYNGIPILSMSGRYFQSRVSWSLMHHSGVSYLNCFSWEEFTSKAIDFYRGYINERKNNISEILLNQSLDGHPYNIEAYARDYEWALKNRLG